MRVLVFGAGGMLGHKLIQILGHGHDVFGTLRGESADSLPGSIFDGVSLIRGVSVEDPGSIRRAIVETTPDVVVNAIGIIKQLPDSKNVINTLTVNSIFPHRLAELGEEFGFRLITISTDCVFSGLRGNYSEADVPDASDLYGKSKNLGEAAGPNCLALRTSIIGHELGSAHSLVDWFLSNRNASVKGFANAIYSGFPTVVFAAIIDNLIRNHPQLSGLYHVSSDPINKYDLLGLVNEAYVANVAIERDEEFKIDRSLDSARFRNETGFAPPGWKEMIGSMAEDAKIYGGWKQ
ncbi:MAG TPA: SDR family oxidoreductase [Pyrinomonadaceae bacterium]|nr:SDR family oxidoreductase [Pyrinomonadaceae bacterium]